CPSAGSLFLGFLLSLLLGGLGRLLRLLLGGLAGGLLGLLLALGGVLGLLLGGSLLLGGGLAHLGAVVHHMLGLVVALLLADALGVHGLLHLVQLHVVLLGQALVLPLDLLVGDGDV